MIAIATEHWLSRFMVIVPDREHFYRFFVAQMGKEWHEAEICRRSTSGRSGVADDWSLKSTSYRDTARENFLSTFFSTSIFRSPFSFSLYPLLHSRLSLLYHLSTCASLRVEFLSYAKSNKLPVQRSSPTKIFFLYPSKSVYGRHGTTGRSGKPLTSLCPFPFIFLPFSLRGFSLLLLPSLLRRCRPHVMVIDAHIDCSSLQDR